MLAPDCYDSPVYVAQFTDDRRFGFTEARQRKTSPGRGRVWDGLSSV